MSKHCWSLVCVVLLLAAGGAGAVVPDAGQPLAGPPSAETFELRASQPGTLDFLYQRWKEGYVHAGGDRNAMVGLAWARGLSSEFSTARGTVHLDLIAGTVRGEVSGFDGRAELWLVDNQEGPGRSVLPETGDRFHRVGPLWGNAERAVATADLGADFFRAFEVDLVVVTHAGVHPEEGGVLFGSRSLFERRYTRSRLGIPERQGLETVTAGVIARRTGEEQEDQEARFALVQAGLVSSSAARGARLFFRGTFDGNGRTCGTCHPVENNQHLDKPFIDILPPDDPLFVAEAGHPNHVPGLERPDLMRNHALILENVDGAEDPTVKFTMRGVPHSLSLATSIAPPNDGRAPRERTGWSGDGAPSPGTLRMFPAGAVFQHATKSLDRIAGVDFTPPTDPELDDMEAFMRVAGRLSDLALDAVVLNDSGAQSGLVAFRNSACNGCHRNAGANTAGGTNFNFDTGVESLANPAQVTEPHPHDGGFGPGTPDPNDPNATLPDRDCDGNGSLDCFGDGTFNTTPLIEAADTAPFFHNNVAATIEDAVAFYSSPEFVNSPSGGGPIVVPVNDVGAFLRVANGAFNIAITKQRVEAAITLEEAADCDPVTATAKAAAPDPCLADPTTRGNRLAANRLMELALFEADDAIEVLEAKALNPAAVGEIRSAIARIEKAQATRSSTTRILHLTNAKIDLEQAKADLGTGLEFVLGEGNLLF